MEKKQKTRAKRRDKSARLCRLLAMNVSAFTSSDDKGAQRALAEANECLTLVVTKLGEVKTDAKFDDCDQIVMDGLTAMATAHNSPTVTPGPELAISTNGRVGPYEAETGRE